VSEIVEAGVVQASTRQQPLPRAVRIPLRLRRAVVGRKHQTVIPPVLASPKSTGGELRPVCP
jgi:hypothetical protein